MLPDGVRLVLKPEPAAELVAISICIRTEPDRTPLEDAEGELVARALFGSSSNRSRENIAASISRVGGSVETLRAADHVSITCVSLPTQVREAIYLLCEVLKNADFLSLERVRSELLAEQKSGSGAMPSALDLLRRSLQARPALAELPLQRVTMGQALAYFQSRYVPERTAIAVTGPFEPESVREALYNSLADFERHATRPLRSEPLYSHATNFPVRTLRQPGASASALVAMPTPPLSDPDYPAFLVLKSVLGEGHASRLFQRLRDMRGIGYSVGALWQTTLSDPLVAYLQWEARPASSKPENRTEKQPTNDAATGSPYNGREPLPEIENPKSKIQNAPLSPEDALRLLTAQIDGLLTDPPSEAEVQRARSVAMGRESLHHERARDRAFLLAWYEAMGVGAEFDADLPTRLAVVTPADMLRVGRNWLTPRASVIIVPNP